MTLEGPEGSGKSSQGQWLAQTVRRRGYPVTCLRDPGSTRLGRALRQVLLKSEISLAPLAEALLFIGGRVQLVEECIRPALKKRQVVICDRFHDSTVAYQGFGGRAEVTGLDRIGRVAIHGMMPDLTLLLDLPPVKGLARLHRTKDRMERKARVFHARVRRGYLALARQEPRRFVVIDASQSPAAVRRHIHTVVVDRLRRSVISNP